MTATIGRPAAAPAARLACGLLPRQPGVYRFRDPAGRVLYIGRATDLRSRTRSYWGDLPDRRHLRRMVAGIATVEAVICASVHEAAWLERNLLERSRPRWNRAIGGAEVPRWFVVDDEPAAPGVRRTRQPDPDRITFGPYLGAERSAAALRGILRVWPLHLTGTRCSGGDRALAAARDVASHDRIRLAGLIVNLLDRSADAFDQLQDTLIAARERASAELNFETAQQIQDDLAAVRWLVSSQRVSGTHPPDLVIHGWADGILVSFSASPTRLDRWRVRRVGERRGRDLAALTPVEWQEFAAVNAELAARLVLAQQRS